MGCNNSKQISSISIDFNDYDLYIQSEKRIKIPSSIISSTSTTTTSTMNSIDDEHDHHHHHDITFLTPREANQSAIINSHSFTSFRRQDSMKDISFLSSSDDSDACMDAMDHYTRQSSVWTKIMQIRRIYKAQEAMVNDDSNFENSPETPIRSQEEFRRICQQERVIEQFYPTQLFLDDLQSDISSASNTARLSDDEGRSNRLSCRDCNFECDSPSSKQSYCSLCQISFECPEAYRIHRLQSKLHFIALAERNRL